MRYRIGEIADLVRGSTREYFDRQLQRGNGIRCLPVVVLNRFDSRIDRVRGEAEPLPDLCAGGQRAEMDCVAAQGEL